MGNVTLPTPVFFAGGALCVLAGFLIGTVAGPHGAARTTATVVSFDGDDSRLCLEGKAVKDYSGTDANGVLCGTWSHSAGVPLPRKGDDFRFVSMDTTGVKGTRPREAIIIYGTVVR